MITCSKHLEFLLRWISGKCRFFFRLAHDFLFFLSFSLHAWLQEVREMVEQIAGGKIGGSGIGEGIKGTKRFLILRRAKRRGKFISTRYPDRSSALGPRCTEIGHQDTPRNGKLCSSAMLASFRLVLDRGEISRFPRFHARRDAKIETRFRFWEDRGKEDKGILLS